MLTAGLGLTGVPVFNVNNNCSSGSTALMMAKFLVSGGYDCTLAVGMWDIHIGGCVTVAGGMTGIESTFAVGMWVWIHS